MSCAEIAAHVIFIILDIRVIRSNHCAINLTDFHRIANDSRSPELKYSSILNHIIEATPMKTSLRVSLSAAIAALFILLAGPADTQAQPPPTCDTVWYRNLTPYTVTIQAWGSAALTPPNTSVPPGGTGYAVAFGPMIVNGIVSATTTHYPWPMIPPFCITGIQLFKSPPPPPTRCFDVCWDQSTCTATITDVGLPPCPNP
jgi:hypothetical protein